jgi:subtilase family protein
VAPKPRLPDLVYAQASPRSIGGTSLFDAPYPVGSSNAAAFTSDAWMIGRAVQRLVAAGFSVLQVSPVTINIAAPAAVYEAAFAAPLVAEERPVVKEDALEDTATFVDTPRTDMSGLIETRHTPLADVVEGVAIEEPRYFHAQPLPLPPTAPYWHLNVPGDVAVGVNAEYAHREGLTGAGIRVAMTDSGWYRHEYFSARGYRAQVVLGPGAADPEQDENGHGTGESANFFAVAPDVDFTMVKLSFVNTIGGFNAAVALAPQVISSSWGSNVVAGPLSAADQALAASIAVAVAQGITVVFSAGNGDLGFPGQHPDVIAAGGVYLDRDGSVRASDYASGFPSFVYPGRIVPDVCGLVGEQPKATYIMLPVPPGSVIDTTRGGGAFPSNDGTATDDGWAAFSGTSAAAPQVAGAVALVRQACPSLPPHAIRDVLMASARDVVTGMSATGATAGPGPDVATGAGLLDVHAATSLARLAYMRSWWGA